MKSRNYIASALLIIAILTLSITIREKRPKTENPAQATLVPTPSRPSLKKPLSQDLSSIPVPTGKLKEIESQLKAKAEAGDASAALGLYLKLSLCENALHKEVTPEEIKAYASAGISPDRFEKSINERISQCSGATNEDLASRGQWLEKAANLGNLQAKLLYSSDPEAIIGSPTDMFRDPESVINYKKNAVKFLSEAASAGSPEGLMQMGDAYNDGILLPKDRIKAYAFYRATQMTTPNVLSKTLSEMESGLTSAEINEGNRQAALIYNNSHN